MSGSLDKFPQTGSAFAVRVANGEIIHSDAFPPKDWEFFKNEYSHKELRMPCCEGSAVAKTSVNGRQFFAHKSGECSTAPETVWHKSAKLLIQSGLKQIGIDAKLETSGPDWRADVYFEVQDRKIAIEIQHSYQHRKKFFERQERYRLAGIEAYWLMMRDVYGTFVSTEQLERIRVEHGGKIPPNHARCRSDVPLPFLS